RLCGVLSIATRCSSLRNRGLFNASVAMRDLVPCIIARNTAVELLLDAARLNGYVAKDGEAAALATIHSGLGLANGEASTLIDDDLMDPSDDDLMGATP